MHFFGRNRRNVISEAKGKTVTTRKGRRRRRRHSSSSLATTQKKWNRSPHATAETKVVSEYNDMLNYGQKITLCNGFIVSEYFQHKAVISLYRIVAVTSVTITADLCIHWWAIQRIPDNVPGRGDMKRVSGGNFRFNAHFRNRNCECGKNHRFRVWGEWFLGEKK